MKDGVYDNLSIQDYHANRSHISATQIKIAKRSLKEFDWYRRGQMPEQTGSHFSFGNAFELALLDQKGYLENVAVLPDQDFIDLALKENPKLERPRNSKVYQDGIKTFQKDAAGKYVINDKGKESFDVIEEMLSSCYQDKAIQALIKNTEYQLSLFWTDPTTGIKLKTRPDICKRKKNVIINVKTTEDGSPAAFSKDLVKYEYPLQAVIEARGCLASGIMTQVDNYFWLVVEKVPPFNATIYEFQERDMAAVSDNLDYVLSRIKKAEGAKCYPGYSDAADNEWGILKANIPLWYNY